MSFEDPLNNLGVRMHDAGGELRVWSASATAMELCLFADDDVERIIDTVPMTRDGNDVWSAAHPFLRVGTRYSIRTDGPDAPAHHFRPSMHLLDPYARGLAPTPQGEWRSYVQDNSFDWN
ncbi:MAG: glgX, partial [Homoserinimonas sp.]|nr:glgX [Homoserinimonas sp.]